MANVKDTFYDIFKTKKPIIGMVHLRALPGSPGYDRTGGMDRIIEHALDEAARLVEGGVDALQVENQFDKPFLKNRDIGVETVAAMAAVVALIRKSLDIPMGINVHLNGVCQALAIAKATGCLWVRAFELANAYISNSGLIEAAGPEALRFRSTIDGTNIKIFGDFHVKHGSHQITADRSLEEQAEDVETALGDALIVTGLKTGTAPKAEDLKRIRNAVTIPVLIGSGLSQGNISDLLPHCDGAIVGSAFKKDKDLSQPVMVEEVKAFMDRVRDIRAS